ncbi:MAG: D-sedoheptulose 7-phosphate isomerase [Candidatus Cloacimonetes bacterium]|nr:D-sedoheptulose 7-phosphate isomerase [Candidatus Cloacimonadota bacterium]
MTQLINSSLSKAQNTLADFIEDKTNIQTISDITELIKSALISKNKVIIFGNGGSMCDAMHFAEELTGRFRKERAPYPAIAISDPSHLTCVANDYGFDEVFARGVEAYAQPNDVVIGISTSGNSPNVIRALERAQKLGCFTIALLGKDGGKLKDACDFELIVKAETTDRIQEIHTLVLHIIIEGIEA